MSRYSTLFKGVESDPVHTKSEKRGTGAVTRNLGNRLQLSTLRELNEKVLSLEETELIQRGIGLTTTGLLLEGSPVSRKDIRNSLKSSEALKTLSDTSFQFHGNPKG